MTQTLELRPYDHSINYRGSLMFPAHNQILFHRTNTKSSIFTTEDAMSENATFGIHGRNRICSFTEKNQTFYFFYA